MNQVSTDFKSLPIKEVSKAIEEALADINAERSGEQLGLYCRWKPLNDAMLKYFRFGHVTMIAASSGMGKSYFLGMLEDDFTNEDINSNVSKKIIVLAFKYEMSAKDEILRTVSGKIGVPYSYLLSSHVDKNTKEYNKITDEQVKIIEQQCEKLKSRRLLYIENAGNLTQLYLTVKEAYLKYPSHKLIVTLDHTLLSMKLDEQSDLELQSNTALCMIRIRKDFGAMVIMLNQLNGEIEKVVRRENPALHYPVKTDIHCGNQLFWACDNVLILHRPELLDIEYYGKHKYYTKRLIHAALIKARKGHIGNIWLKDNLDKGRILTLTSEELDNLKKNQE